MKPVRVQGSESSSILKLFSMSFFFWLFFIGFSILIHSALIHRIKPGRKNKPLVTILSAT